MWIQSQFFFLVERAMPWCLIFTVSLTRFRVLGNALLSMTVRMFTERTDGRAKTYPNVSATILCVGRPAWIKDGKGKSQMGTNTHIVPDWLWCEVTIVTIAVSQPPAAMTSLPWRCAPSNCEPSCCCALPVMGMCTFKLWARINTSCLH